MKEQIRSLGTSSFRQEQEEELAEPKCTSSLFALANQLNEGK